MRKRQQIIPIAEETPCRTSIAPVHKLKETFDNDILLGVVERSKNDSFGHLIKQEH